MRDRTTLSWLLLILACGCGGSTPPPAEPSQSTEPPAAAAGETASEPAAGEKPATPSAAEPAAPPPATSATSAPAKIEFPPHAGVEAAIKAVPQGAPRLNMSDDTLQKPLLDLTRYEKCKIPRSTKVSVTVAVYDGAAVGVDVITKPKTPRIDGCVDEVIRGLTWDKVASLNTVKINF